MRALGIAALWGLLGLGCGQSEHAPARPRWVPPEVDLGGEAQLAGSRLRPLVWTSDDGPPIRTARFFDLERDEECSFSADDEGTLHCFPTQVATDHGLGSPYVDPGLFADARCRERVYVPPIGATAPPRYVATVHEAGCASGTRVYELAAELEEKPFYGPTCDGSVGGLEHVYRRGGRIPNHAFVRAAESVTAVGAGRLAARQLTAADGTARLQGFYDLELDAPCELTELDAEARCATSPVLRQGQWPGELEMDGEECWDLVLMTDECTIPGTGRVFDDETWHARVPLPASAVVAPRPAVAACLAAARRALPGALWILGDEVPADAFPTPVETDVEGARLTATYWQDETGAVVLPDDEDNATFLDRELGTTCWLRVATDGAMRCLPWRPITLFADPACSQPLLQFREEDPVPAFASLVRDGRYRVHETTEPYAGPVYHDASGLSSSSSIDCRQTEGTMLYSMGPELEPDRFPRYELVRWEPP